MALWAFAFSVLTEPLNITYAKGVNPRFGDFIYMNFDVLSDPIPFTTIESYQPQQNPWDAPFFFQDSRHVFYVSTSEQMTTIPDFNDIAILPPNLVPDIPPLVLQQDLTPAHLTTAGPRPGIGDPAPAARFISEDAKIRTALGTVASMRPGNREIGQASGRINQ